MAKTKTTDKVTLPDSEFNRKWAGEKNYKVVKRRKDPRFGEVTILKNHQTGEVLFMKENMVNNKAKATENILQLQSRMRLNHPNLLRMVDYSTEIKS